MTGGKCLSKPANTIAPWQVLPASAVNIESVTCCQQLTMSTCMHAPLIFLFIFIPTHPSRRTNACHKSRSPVTIAVHMPHRFLAIHGLYTTSSRVWPHGFWADLIHKKRTSPARARTCAMVRLLIRRRTHAADCAC